MHEEDRNIYIFIPDGWKHLGTNTVVQRRGIPLDTEDIEALKERCISKMKMRKNKKKMSMVNSDG